MEYVLTPKSFKREFFAWWEGAFNEEELDWLQNKALENNSKALVDKSSFIPETRRSEITWLSCTSETEWVYKKLSHVVSSINSQFFFFNLTGFGEPLQLTNYNEEYNGMYNWHVDFGNDPNGPSRKLSLVLQLSDPVDYEGGVLELITDSFQPKKMRKQRGLIVVFPSWTLHQVTPVTKGHRQTLVCWISGPPFK